MPLLSSRMVQNQSNPGAACHSDPAVLCGAVKTIVSIPLIVLPPAPHRLVRHADDLRRVSPCQLARYRSQNEFLDFHHPCFAKRTDHLLIDADVTTLPCHRHTGLCNTRRARMTCRLTG